MSVALAVSAACAVIYLFLVARPAHLARSVVKTAAVALLAVDVAAGQGPGLLMLALVACALGDWFLSRDGEASFLAGIGAFAAGHLAYVALFATRPEFQAARIVAAPQVFLAVALGLLGIATALVVVPRAGALGGAVLVYIPIILGMGVTVLGLPTTYFLAVMAALAFIASDLTLAGETFILPESHPARRVTPYVIWPLYWLAQAGFTVAFH